MLDTKRLLDQFLGGPNMGQDQLPQTYQGQRGGGGLNDLVGSAQSMLGGNLGGVGGGAIAGGLAAILLGSKTGRKLAGNAVTYGGMAALGALAYRAYQNYQAGKAPSASAATLSADVAALPPPEGTPFNPKSEAAQQSLARNLLRAMIAAAKADGHIDAAEQANIFAQMDQLNLSSEEKAFVVDELRRPLDIDAVGSGVNSPEEAAEIYTASLLAIDVDNAAERGYLGMLAARLNLDEKLIAHLHATIEGTTEKAPAASG
jgi:uncharacterized membrane protein YebE (DUF533 family)